MAKRRKTSKLKRAWKKTNTSNKILLLLGVFIFSFIVTMIVVFCVKGAVPDTLIQYTLGAGGVEALVLAGIKISKVVVGEKIREDSNDDY